MLRSICNLTPPATGWDALPTSADRSLEADLARIKYYRNSVYGHVNQKMEITNSEFPQLWQEIREALLGIAGQISPAKKTEWQEAIDNFLQDPLTAEDERNVEELLEWYRNDMEVKESIGELKSIIQEMHGGMGRLETGLKRVDIATQEIKEVKDMMLQLVRTPARGCQSTEGKSSSCSLTLFVITLHKTSSLNYPKMLKYDKPCLNA